MLGKGAFGSVYEAHCSSKLIITGRCAIKVINKVTCQRRGMLDRIQNEIKIHSSLNHLNILRLYSHLEDSTNFYLVLELCENGELFKFVRGNSLCGNERAISQFTAQIIEGIGYLHSKGIIHRDLKLSNIFINKDLVIKIGDFGLAKRLGIGRESGLQSEANTLCGTPNYISPEIISRKPYGFEADIWSFGVILYSLLVGNAPFETQQLTETLKKIMTTKLALPDTLSANAKDLLASLLNPNPNARLSIQSIKRHLFYQKEQKQFPSFSLDRLKPTKQALTNGTIEITGNTQVTLEYSDESYIFITNGREILLKHKYQPGLLKTWPLAAFTTLPTELVRKYRFVCKFVELVRSKTLKIGLTFPAHKKAYLMENGDFYYYSKGRKLHFSPKESLVELMERADKRIIFTQCNTTELSCLATLDPEMEQEATKIFQEMLILEKSTFIQFPYISRGSGPIESDVGFSLTQNLTEHPTRMQNRPFDQSTNYQFGPILIGNSRRVNGIRNDENIYNFNSALPSKPSAIKDTKESLANFSSPVTTVLHMLNSSIPIDSWKYLQDIGWGCHFPNEKNKFAFLFIDGAQILLDGEQTFLHHRQSCTGNFTKYPINSLLPPHIKTRLKHLESFVKLLMAPSKFI